MNRPPFAPTAAYGIATSYWNCEFLLGMARYRGLVESEKTEPIYTQDYTIRDCSSRVERRQRKAALRRRNACERASTGTIGRTDDVGGNCQHAWRTVSEWER